MSLVHLHMLGRKSEGLEHNVVDSRSALLGVLPTWGSSPPLPHSVGNLVLHLLRLWLMKIGILTDFTFLLVVHFAILLERFDSFHSLVCLTINIRRNRKYGNFRVIYYPIYFVK